MDAAQALADLTEISSQIQAAVLFDEKGSVHGSTLGADDAAQAFADAASALLERAAGFRSQGGTVTQLDASTAGGNVFVVRDGARRIAATTGPEPTVGLVFYDLKSCLRSSADVAPETPKRTRRKKADDEA